MFRSIALCVATFIITLAFSSSAIAQTGDFPVGSKIDDFKMSDVYGKEHSFKALQGKNGTVLIWLSAQCPVVKMYNERIAQISAEFKERGINFVGINSNATEGIDWVKSNAEEHYKFPVLIDKGNVLADKLGASVTPEAYFFNTSGVLLYHGAIDNDRSGRNIQEQYLKTAFEATLGGKPVERTKANAFGCTIKRVGM